LLFPHPAPSVFSTLSLHDALPIYIFLFSRLAFFSQLVDSRDQFFVLPVNLLISCFQIFVKCDAHVLRPPYSSGWNSSLPTPQIGHTQSSGRSSNAVPGSIPLSGSPISGS